MTHEKREPWVQKGTTVFYFTDDPIERVLEKARVSVKDRDVRIQGGGNIIQQYLNAGLVDEFWIHISPIILGSGIRLIEKINRDIYEVAINEVIPSKWSTHVNYSLTNKLSK